MATRQHKAAEEKRARQEQALQALGLTNLFLLARNHNMGLNEVERILQRPDAPKSVAAPDGYPKRVGARELRFWKIDEVDGFINSTRNLDFRAAKHLLSVLNTTYQEMRI